jgi:predicted CXXCH cytochrome family protein
MPQGAVDLRFLLRRIAVAAIAIAAVLVAVPSLALAYHTDGRETQTVGAIQKNYTCIDCHGDERDAWTGEGPHGYYNTNTTKCRMCHTIHKAPAASIMLLPRATIKDSCFTCHDGTGAVGVYSAITVRGYSVGSSHSIDVTKSVPGGSQPLNTVLGCDSCHTPHRATQIEPYLGDNEKAFYHGFGYVSNRALRDDVGGHARGTYTKYGADWCAGCHDERTDWGAMHNHPVEASTTPGYFYYDNVAVVTAADQTTTVLDRLGYSNFGYIMPEPRTPEQAGHAPICQQCHEDPRNPGVPGAAVPFESSLKDYGTSPRPVNPVFLSFPHETTSTNLLSGNGDGLCLRCHDADMLP